MTEHYRAFSAVFPLMIRENAGTKRILLHRRQNTGYMDGLWDFAASGHIDENETATQAIVRECAEEVGINVKVEDLQFAHLSHRIGINGGRTYFDLYFFVRAFTGEPAIMEPEKCAELGWFDLYHLPEDMITIRKTDLVHCLASDFYSEKINRQ